MVGTADLQSALETRLEAAAVEVVDISGGCGSSFEVYVTSQLFDGKRLLQRHKLVNEALAHLMPDMHALSIKRTKTPAEVAAETPAK